MIEVIVVGEGQTEETFVRDVLGPALTPVNISLQPRLIDTSSRARGGALSSARVLRFLRNTLRERRDTYVTTFFDLYGLPSDFPGLAAARGNNDPQSKCRVIEEALAKVAIEESGCRAGRFFAHIQPYEFEAPLFSDVSGFGEARRDWSPFVEALGRIREAVATPEHINDGPDTHPSIRLMNLLQPRYDKLLHGSGIATLIGLERIRGECLHFDGWLKRIEALHPL